jgi:hypothetical protein
MAWTDPTTINTDPRDPVTSDFGTAALDNPVAIAEGATGAPRVTGRALDVFNAEATNNRTTVGTITALTVTGLDTDGIDRVLIVGTIAGTGPAGGPMVATATYELSSNGGATWGSAVTIGQADGPTSDTRTTGISYTVDVSAHNAIRVRVRYSGTTGGDATLVAQLINLGGS